MGRTVPSFRLASMDELAEWRAYRKALPKDDRAAFDALVASARLYTSASSAAVRTSRFEGLAMAMVLNHQRLLRQCIDLLAELRRGRP
jgi:hypothetical protein